MGAPLVSVAYTTVILSANVEPVPVSHLMPSWQAPQDLRLGISR